MIHILSTVSFVCVLHRATSISHNMGHAKDAAPKYRH